MSKQKLPSPKPQPAAVRRAVSETPGDGLNPWRIFLWLVFFANSLVIWPGCLDLSLVPRFGFLSVSLLATLVLVWRDLRTRGDLRLHGFDLLFLVWYGWNAASISWAFSVSEAVFFAQKVLVAFLVYWLFRQAMHRDEGMVRRTLGLAVPVLTVVVVAMLLFQLAQAIGEVGLRNEGLYEFVKGVYGNKGLASDFLFFLLIFNVLLFRETKFRLQTWLLLGLLFGLILLLQTRTVYLAVAAGALVYFPGRAFIEPGFRPLFFKKLLPIGLLALAGLAALIYWKGKGSTLAERLNPITYMESVSASERRLVWYKTNQLIADEPRPMLGMGNGSWKIHFPKKSIEGSFRMQEKGIIFTRAHNDYLEIWAELGRVGLGLFVALFGLVSVAAVFYFLKTPGDENGKHDVLVLPIGLLGYCIIQTFDFPRERMEMQVILSIFFAWLAFRTRDFWAKKSPGVFLGPIFPVFAGLAAAGLAFNIWVAQSRIAGERHNYKLLELLNKKDWRGVVREADAAENDWYEFNDVALPVRWHKGVALFNLNDFKGATEAFEHAYRLNPWSFQVINNYASALVKSGQIPEAIKLYEKTLEINPRYDEGKFNLAFSWYQMGDYAKALNYAQSVDTIPGPKTPEDFAKNEAINKKREDFVREISKKLQ